MNLFCAAIQAAEIVASEVVEIFKMCQRYKKAVLMYFCTFCPFQIYFLPANPGKWSKMKNGKTEIAKKIVQKCPAKSFEQGHKTSADLRKCEQKNTLKTATSPKQTGKILLAI